MFPFASFTLTIQLPDLDDETLDRLSEALDDSEFGIAISHAAWMALPQAFQDAGVVLLFGEAL